MHHIKFTDTHEDKYTVYVKCLGGGTLSLNHRELGLNYAEKQEAKKAEESMLQRLEGEPKQIR